MTRPPGPSITCPRCGRTSYHPGDIDQGYCGWCHWWTSDPAGMLNRPEVIAQAEAEGAITPLMHGDAPTAFAVPIRNRFALAAVMSAAMFAVGWPHWEIALAVTVFLFALVVYGWRHG